MTSNTSLEVRAKIDGPQGYGAPVRLYDRVTESREVIAHASAAARGASPPPGLRRWRGTSRTRGTKGRPWRGATEAEAYRYSDRRRLALQRTADHGLRQQILGIGGHQCQPARGGERDIAIAMLSTP